MDEGIADHWKDPHIEESLIRRSIPLRRLGLDLIPDKMASGCMVECFGARWILTVSHAVGDGGDWALECGFESCGKTKLYRLGQMNFAVLSDISNASQRELDLAYVKVPDDLNPRWQPSDDAGVRMKDLPRELSLISCHEPREDSMYGFAGNVQLEGETHFGDLHIATEQVAYSNLRYVRDHGEFHVFAFPQARPDDKWLGGTSGSPILDRAGRVVSLVARSGEGLAEILGISVQYFRPLLKASAQLD